MIIVSALSLSLRDKEREREKREIELDKYTEFPCENEKSQSRSGIDPSVEKMGF